MSDHRKRQSEEHRRKISKDSKKKEQQKLSHERTNNEDIWRNDGIVKVESVKKGSHEAKKLGEEKTVDGSGGSKELVQLLSPRKQEESKTDLKSLQYTSDRMRTSRKVENIASDVNDAEKSITKKIMRTPTEKKVEYKLSEIVYQYISNYREEKESKKRKMEKKNTPSFSNEEILQKLTELGIPFPSDEDLALLDTQNTYEWDTKGGVTEYYSHMVKCFIPINIMGRYRGCHADEKVIQGLDLSQLSPKKGVIEGFVVNDLETPKAKVQRVMKRVSKSESHKKYLVNVRKFQMEVLPIPLFYDLLNFGLDVSLENCDDRWYHQTRKALKSLKAHTASISRRLLSYGALGLEPIKSERAKCCQEDQRWFMPREEIVKDVLARNNSKAVSENDLENINLNVPKKKSVSMAHDIKEKLDLMKDSRHASQE